MIIFFIKNYSIARWIYNGDKYRSIPIDWKEFDYYNGVFYCEKYNHLIESCYASNERFEILIYNPKWDKCFMLLSREWYGNELKAQIEDIYTKEYIGYLQKNLELVIKRK